MGHDPRRFLLPLALPILLLSAACGPGATTSRGEHREESGSPEILWDDWGVPHVFAATDADLFYAFGWATAHNHADLLLRLYGQARGRAAEYWGESYLDGDRYVWTMGVPGRATEWLGQQDDEIRGFLEAYVSGINDYAATHPEAIADDAEIVLPVTAEDALAHTQRILHFTFVSNPGEIRGARRSLEAAGSNAWAVGPPMSATSKSLLVANPHLPWADLFTWFESQLIGPEVDVYGATLVGAPFLTIAFNDALGWTHTVNTHDGRDLFTLELDGDGYRYDGEVRPFEREEVTLKVLQEDKSLREETLEVRRSIHGPVVAINGGQAVSLAVVGLEASEIFRQYWDMSRADNLADWMEAIRRIQMPMFTFMYADRDGNILHHFGGETPVRPQGDWSTWSRPVPGDTSDWAWSGTHEFDDLPTVLNPESGWLQNANDPPWTTTFPEPLDPTAFPSYMAPQFMHFRAQRSARMLAEETDGLTFDEAITLKQSTRLELADRILDDLQAAVEESGNSLASEPMEVLAAWDRQTETTSRGAVLFARFEQEMRDRGLGLIPPWNEAGFAASWSADDPRTTPDGLGDGNAAVEALVAAATDVRERHGALDVPWGDVYRVRRNGHDYPANGGPGALGIFRVVNYDRDGDRWYATSGDSYVAIVEFDQETNAQVLLSYGNSSQPDSPHAGDQLRLFSEKQLRPAWRTRDEIEANLEKRETLVRD